MFRLNFFTIIISLLFTGCFFSIKGMEQKYILYDDFYMLLMCHIKEGDIEYIKKTIEQDPDKDYTVFLSNVLNLSYVRQETFLAIIRLLVDAGANVNKVSFHCYSNRPCFIGLEVPAYLQGP